MGRGSPRTKEVRERDRIRQQNYRARKKAEAADEAAFEAALVQSSLVQRQEENALGRRGSLCVLNSMDSSQSGTSMTDSALCGSNMALGRQDVCPCPQNVRDGLNGQHERVQEPQDSERRHSSRRESMENAAHILLYMAQMND